MQDAISAPAVGGIVRLTRFVLKGTFLVELVGALALLPAFCRDYGLRGVWMAVFHSVSAFCNAGFDILGRADALYPSLTAYTADLLVKEVREAFAMEEVRWYLIIFAAATLMIAANLTIVQGGSPFYYLHHSAFQVASVMTTTGFATVDFNLWPNFSRSILVVLMFIGACAGSTGGGMKVSRYIIYFKTLRKELSTLIHPRSVKVIQCDGKAVDHDTIRSANIYLIAYIFIYMLSVLLISFDKFDLTTNFTAVAATFNNIGPGLNVVGPTGNFAGFSMFSKIVLIFDMLAGRLEIFPMLILLAPGTWKK